MTNGAAVRPARRAATKKAIVDDDCDSDEFGGKEHHIPNHYNGGKAPVKSDDEASAMPASVDVDELANAILTGIVGHSREKLIKESEEANNAANALTIAIPEGAVEEAEEALEGAEAEEEALVDEGAGVEQEPNAAAMDLDNADDGGSDRSLPVSRSGRARATPGRYLV